MPRLNYGTLLENIVVLESTRMCLDRCSGNGPIGFATAFALYIEQVVTDPSHRGGRWQFDQK